MTHYQVLGVPPAASQEQVHKAYLRLALLHHPDKGGDAEQFKLVALAYGVLKDAAQRRRYDEQLRLLGRPCGKCGGTGQTVRTVSFTTIKKVPCKQCGGTGQSV